MLNKSTTHNQRTAFSSMTVWCKIRNTNIIYSHAELIYGQSFWKILSSKFILNKVQHRLRNLFKPSIVMLEKVADGVVKGLLFSICYSTSFRICLNRVQSCWKKLRIGWCKGLLFSICYSTSFRICFMTGNNNLKSTKAFLN